jgi:hypothetical protein
MGDGLDREELGRQLGMAVFQRWTTTEIADWAFGLYLDAHTPSEVRDHLMPLVAMAEGSEFELSESELRTLAEELQRPTL